MELLGRAAWDLPAVAQTVAGAIAILGAVFGFFRWRLQRRERLERESAEEFRRIRRRLKDDRGSLQKEVVRTLRKKRPDAQSFTNTYLFALPGWIHEVPVSLESVEVVFVDCRNEVRRRAPTGCLPRALAPYQGYSQAVEALDRPSKFDNYVQYRLLEIAPFALRFSPIRANYFQKLDFGEYLAHEWACGRSSPRLRRRGTSKLWRTLDQPRDYVVLTGISTLTLLHDGTSLRFLMHERGKSATAYAMGVHHVIPAGEFQPSCQAPVSFNEDFDLWRNIMREYGEEVLGLPECDGAGNVPFNYSVAPYDALERERRSGNIRLFYFGTGLDPITFQGEILTVAVFRHETFDAIFPHIRTSNSEGQICTDPNMWGRPFTADECDHYMNANTLSSAQLLLSLSLRNKLVFEQCFANEKT